MITSFASKIEKNTALVYDLRATKNEKTRFFIVRIDPARHDAYLRAFNENNNLNLKDYGKVLHMGKGEPSDDLKAELHEKYGMYKSLFKTTTL